MKNVLGLVLIVAIIAMVIYIGVSTDMKCEKAGGVVVNSGRGVNNCWKDGNFVNL